ncbi:hypothetical protein OEV98_13555 [Caldibacillus lycopersici]|uniref:DUF3794 domain-containing protein n=1 Tax=Perspicuibacillus lycopersici TaxID=1325689 RepID=A0AAE3IYU6_9BACI|nr:hypothetical protein [Perspicuibacillus lycopersici]MCU9614565.1 hypothetical protein [Perspicuibacillus lycopersici]
MQKRIKAIQGQQVDPNPIGPECIRVTKIYDWVTLTNRERSNVTIPEECLDQITECLEEGNTISVTCSEVVAGRSCDLVGAVPTDIGVPGAQIVTLAFQVQINVQFLCNGAPLCSFVTPVGYVDDVILCFPEGTEINCQIYQVQCNAVYNQMLGNVVVLDVVICPSIRVEAEVALEVEARFCGPRQIIPIPEQEVACPFPEFPPQCPTFFPAPSTVVQGAAEYTGPVTLSYIEGAAATGGIAARQVFTTTPTGEIDFTALIADDCNLANSRIQINFLETPGATPTPMATPEDELDQSFTFTATDFNQPTPVGTNGLTVTGTGIFSPSGGVSENATFTLTMTDVDPVGDSATITITSATAIVTIALTDVTNVGLEVEVAPCSSL